MTEEITLGKVISDAVEAKLDDVMTCSIGKIQKYDPKTETADIIPMMRRAVNLGHGLVDYEELPVLPNVPVVQPRAGGFYIRLPVKKGDYVALHFTHDDIANWRETGDQAEPDDLRRHSLASCIAYVGMAHSKMPLSAAPMEVAARTDNLVFGIDGSPIRFVLGHDGILIGELATAPIALAPPLLAYLADMASAIQAVSDTNKSLKAVISALVTATAMTGVTAAQGTAFTAAEGAAETAVATVQTPPTIASTLVKSL